MKKHAILNIVIISAVVIVLVVMVMLSLSTIPTSDPPPRNVRIFVSGSRMMNYILLEVNENYLNAVVLSTLFMWCYETGEVSTGGLEHFDRALLDDFADISSPRRWNIPRSDMPIGIIDSGSVELSQEQLHNVWQKIDNVVQNYEEPQGISISPTLMKAVIDGELYWISFVYSDTLQSRRDRRLIDASDIDLAILTHYLADLAPIQIRW